ncbi:MAG: PaaI family thioesterase [Bacteroidales bacterium]|nr:PaaI family thioesterase [Bacteroidales bacterium]
MQKINNPWAGIEGYNCFGCSPDNPLGLRMSFAEDGDYIVSSWQPGGDFQGWVNTLHGGIQATLIDETAGWVVFRKLHTSGYTSKMDIRYLKPVSTADGPVTIKARLINQKLSMAFIEVRLYDSHDELCADATCVYRVYPRDVAERDFHFRDSK